VAIEPFDSDHADCVSIDANPALLSAAGDVLAPAA
jgi:hypothetical protein